MRKLWLWVGLCGAAVQVMSADSSQSGWSSPREMVVPNDSGPVKIFSQTREIPDLNLGTITLQLLFRPETGSVWVGLPQEQYFSANGKLWSASRIGTRLLLRPGATLRSGETPIAFADNWAASYSAGRSDWKSYASGIQQYDLRIIFGGSAMGVRSGPLQGRMSVPQAIANDPFGVGGFTFSAVAPSYNSVLLSMAGFGGDALELTFTKDLNELVNAKINGTSFSPLVSAKMPLSQRSWHPKTVTLQTITGPISAQGCERSFDGSSRVTEGGIIVIDALVSYAPSVLVLVLPSGAIWTGPSFCKLAIMNDSIVGLTMDELSIDLLLFVGPQQHIPMGDALRNDSFKAVLDKLEREMQAGLLPPDRRISLREIFSAAGAASKRVKVRQIGLDGSNLLVKLGTLDEQLTVRFSPDFEILSTEWSPGR